MQTVSQLRQDEVRLFPRITREALAVWSRHGETVTVPGGTVLLREGDWLYPFVIVIAGRVEVTKALRQQEIVLAIHEAGDFLGEVTLLAGSTCPATARAKGETTLLVIPNEFFRELVVSGLPEAAEVVRALAVRSAEIGAMERHQEKLASLGRITAGLAHELNNPAASLSRQSTVLSQELQRNQRLLLEALPEYTPEQKEAVAALMRGRSGAHQHDAMQMQDEADRMEVWLVARQIDDASLHAINLSESGVQQTDLETLETMLGAELRGAIRWLGNTAVLLSAAASIELGSRRISDIVSRIEPLQPSGPVAAAAGGSAQGAGCDSFHSIEPNEPRGRGACLLRKRSAGALVCHGDEPGVDQPDRERAGCDAWRWTAAGGDSV